MHLPNTSAKMPSGPKKRRATAKKKKALENLNSIHANNSQGNLPILVSEITTNHDSDAAVDENAAVITFSSSVSPADSSDIFPKEGVPVQLNGSVKLGMKENDTAAVVPAFSVVLPDAASYLPKESSCDEICEHFDQLLIDKDMIDDDDMKFDFAEYLPKEGIHVESNEDSDLGLKQNDSTILPSVDDQIPVTSAVALSTETDLNLTMEKVANLEPENPEKSLKFLLPIDPSVEKDYENAFKSPNDCGILSQNLTRANRLERFKKSVIDELRETDKMRGFLQKVLDDLNSMLSDERTSLV